MLSGNGAPHPAASPQTAHHPPPQAKQYAWNVSGNVTARHRHPSPVAARAAGQRGASRTGAPADQVGSRPLPILTLWGRASGRTPFLLRPGSGTLPVKDELGKDAR
jgi:hypothetical protein